MELYKFSKTTTHLSNLILITTLSAIILAAYQTEALIHHLELINDPRNFVSVSTFGYLIGGNLRVNVNNLTIKPDPSDEFIDNLPYGFMIIRTEGHKNVLVAESLESRNKCILTNEVKPSFESITMTFNTLSSVVHIGCTDKFGVPSITPIGQPSLPTNNKHNVDKRYVDAARLPNYSELIISMNDTVNVPGPVLHPKRQHYPTWTESCSVPDLPLTVKTDTKTGHRSYSFNFSMSINDKSQEGLYLLVFINCRGSHHRYNEIVKLTRFDLDISIHETNAPHNYLSAGRIPLPQMYFMFSVLFFLVGSVWMNYLRKQKHSVFKIHHLMSVLILAKSASLLFHAINYHYIARDGHPVLTWAYLYYATRTLKGALFFITLVLIGSGWTFIKHILSDKDKKIILLIVPMQILAHIAEIVLDESTEGVPLYEFWAQLCSLIDLFCCIAILYPISWSVRQLEEASRTDGKAAINLKKLELFKRFYIISTIYIYITRIVTFVFVSILSYNYSYLAYFFSEFATLIYFIITGYYFQPLSTNPYTLLSTELEIDEEIVFSVVNTKSDDDKERTTIADASSFDLNIDSPDTSLVNEDRRVIRRNVEDIV